jgi:DNA repair ATPase RecN
MTFSNVKLLNTAEQIEEIATMLSGTPPSDSARNNARELLNNIQK